MNKILKHPSLLFSDDLKQICQPLKSLGIEYFSHVIIDDKNQFSGMGTSPEFVKLYFENKYYNIDIHQVELSSNVNYILWDTIEKPDELSDLYNNFNNLSFGHSFTIIKHINGFKHYFDFSSTLGTPNVNQGYLNNFDHLNRFILFFIEQINLHSGLRKAHDIKFAIEEDKRTYCDNFNLNLPINRIYFSQNVYLTFREVECLHWLSFGKAINETANMLSITTRTLKAHLANIKTKLGCTSLFQLGYMYQDWQKNNPGKECSVYRNL